MAAGPGFSDFFTFTHLLTPAFVKGMFWVGFLLIELGGLLRFISAVTVSTPGAWSGAAEAIVTMVVGPVLLRAACEAVIVAHRRREDLETMKCADGR